MNDEAPTRAPEADETVLFSAILEPQRSATVRHINTAVIVFAAASLPASLAFLSIGAWPVTGFIGLDIVLLLAALRFHHWAGRTHEIIHLTGRSLVVERVSHWGRRKAWEFQPHWLQVAVEDVDDHHNRLAIRTRGLSLYVGSFLTSQEKVELARALRRNLARLSVWSGTPAPAE